MHSLRSLAVLLFGVTVLACESAVEPTAPVSSLQFAKSGRAPVAQVSAGGKADISDFFPGFPPEFFAFNASVDADGNAKGQFQADFTIPDARLHVEISCLSVSGNQAWIGGRVTHSDRFRVGLPLLWSVVDNGEGKNAAAPDRISGFGVGDPSTCVEQNPGFEPIFDWSGNIQVKGSTDGI